MSAKIIAWCVKNRLLVCIITVMIAAAGVWAMLTIPLDAIPDLSDVQVIIYSQWMGRDPATIEDQVTYPLTTKMLAVPDAKVVRGYSFFGFSLVYVIFEDGTDLYWARSRVLEYLSELQGRLPPGVDTALGPDATGVGWVYEYTLEPGPYCPEHADGLYVPRGREGPYYEKPQEGLELELCRILPATEPDAVQEAFANLKAALADSDSGLSLELQQQFQRMQDVADNGVWARIPPLAAPFENLPDTPVAQAARDLHALVGRCPLDGELLVFPDLDLGDLRALQDWYLRYQLTGVEGVAEVASVGGFERQFQVTVDPNKLFAYNIPLKKVIASIKRSNNDVGGRLLELTETEYMVRGRGYLRAVGDLERTVIGVTKKGTPILVRDVAQVELGPDLRRGVAEKDGKGQVVAGIIVMRFGENALEVIERVREKIEELEKGLPAGVELRTAYDRSALIKRSIATLKTQLVEEMLIVAAICILFLWHARSALVAAVTLPLGILMSFIVMNAIGVNANIMSLGGIAIAIGAMVDAAVVLVENAHKRLDQWRDRDRWETIIHACQEVGPALFFSLLIITVSFLPVFSLQAQSGRLFAPLAYTKTFAMAASSLLAITLIPVAIAFFVNRSIFPDQWRGNQKRMASLLIVLLPPLLLNLLAPVLGWNWFLEYRGAYTLGWVLLALVLVVPQRIRREEDNPVSRFLIWLYLPAIRWTLRHPWTVIAVALVILAATLFPYSRLGSEFMPPLNEGDILYMPTAIPGISITEAQRTLQIQDKLFKQFPEVDVVLGKIGRAETATDPAPLTMVETTVTMKPKEQWPERIIPEELIADVVAGALESARPEELPAEELLAAAEEVEKMARTEFNNRIREAYNRGAELASLAGSIPDDLAPFLVEHAARGLVEQAVRYRRDQVRDALKGFLAHHPLGEVPYRLEEERLELESGFLAQEVRKFEGLLREHRFVALAGRIEEVASEFEERTREALNNSWDKLLEEEGNREQFLADLGNNVASSMTDSLAEQLVEMEIISTPLMVEDVASRIERELSPDEFRPLPLRRLRDINELMYEDMDPVFQFPGLTNAWTMPIKTRIDMLATGIKTPIGIKVFGPDLKTLEELAIKIERVVKRDPGTLSAIAERVFGGNYFDFDIDRDACARHGLTVGDVQDVIETAIGGMNITQTVEGLYRFKVNVRYPRELRDDPDKLRRVLVATPLGEQLPIGQLAKLEVRDGPPAIKSENAMREAIVYVDLRKGQDVGSYVERVRKLVEREVKMPPGYYVVWSGQFEYMQEARKRLLLIAPVTLVIIFLLLYFNMGNVGEAFITIVTLCFALIGGVWFLYLAEYNLSVAVAIGFIALGGLAAETAVVMHVYLELSYKQRKQPGRGLTRDELYEAIEEGAALRVRPKMMTVMTTILALVPIMWATGAGAGPMKRMAAPMIGGLITSTIHTLILIPVYYMFFKQLVQWKEERKRKTQQEE